MDGKAEFCNIDLMKYFRTLYVQVVIGILLGILVGAFFPSFAKTGKLISEVFINMIKMMITPVIFFTVVLGIAGAGNLKQVGRIGGKALLYFELVTTLALVIGLFTANFIQPGNGIDPKHIPVTDTEKYTSGVKDMDWTHFFSGIVPENIVGAFATGNIIQVLFFGVLFSFGLRHAGAAGESLILVFEKINKVLFQVLKIVIKVSPIGAFGGMAYTVGTFGFGSLAAVAKLML